MRKQIFKTISLIVACFILLSIFYFRNLRPGKAVAADVVQNLDELMARKARLVNNTYTYSNTFLEDPVSGIWQTETLNYTDTVTGNEVWKLTNTPLATNHTADVSISQWSADGRWLLFASSRQTAKWVTGSKIWMLTSIDGSNLQFTANAASRSPDWIQYVNWNPAKADLYYTGGRNSGGFDMDSVYENRVDANGNITTNKILTVTNHETGDVRLESKNSISADGSTIYYRNFPKTKAYVANLSGVPSWLSSSDGYDRILNLDSSYWGETPCWTTYHASVLSGAKNGIDGIWHYLMPTALQADCVSSFDSGGSWWRARPTGSGINGQPVHLQDRVEPYDWGSEVEPMSTLTITQNKNTPWTLDSDPNTTDTHYLSHMVPDRWAHYLVSAKTSSSPYGPSLWDTRLHRNLDVFEASRNSSHHDWEAWSDWFVNSGSAANTGATPTTNNWTNQVIFAHNYKDTNLSKALAYTMHGYNGTDEVTATYDHNTRPVQSPDGTKAMYHGTFLNTVDNQVQIFWTVAYNPYPPEIKSAVKNGASVRLNWDFNQGENCSSSSGTTPRTGPTPNFTDSRTYATRGWPHETLDCPPSPREIKNFRIWSSDDNSNWMPIGTTPYNNCSGSNECGMWTETSWSYDATQANNTTKYYAITSVEHSGLESKTLSNVWKVTTDASGIITIQVEQTAYPADPGGDSNFYQTKPVDPINQAFAYKQAPATADGQYTVSWTAPVNKALIRYYNIYAQDGEIPDAIQQRRIASISASSDYENDDNFSYIDWLGNPNGSTQYKITAVDYQGNESGEIDVVAPGAPSGLSVE